MLFRPSLLSAWLCYLLAFSAARGAELVIFDFAKETNLAPSAWDEAVQASRIEGGVRLLATNASMGYRTPVLQVQGVTVKTIRPDGVTPSDKSYFGFSVTLSQSNTQYALESVSFLVARGGDLGPRGYDIRTSADNFKTSLGSLDVPTSRPTMTGQTVSLRALGPINGPLEIRFYLHAPNPSATLEFDDIVLRGTP